MSLLELAPPPPPHPVSTGSSLLGFLLSVCGVDAATKRPCAEHKRDTTIRPNVDTPPDKTS
jgi:hypothetical protein